MLQAYLIYSDNDSQELYSNDRAPNYYLLNTLSICQNRSAVMRWLNISTFYTHTLFSGSPTDVIFLSLHQDPKKLQLSPTYFRIFEYLCKFISDLKQAISFSSIKYHRHL